MSTIRAIKFAFNPVNQDHTVTSPKECPSFSFLREALYTSISGLENTNAINPGDIRVPWSTKFPASLQCKYWKEAEEAALEMMQQIQAAKLRDQGTLPGEIQNFEFDARATSKYNELLETAVTAPINMFPAGDANRVRIMAKANLLIFMHDGTLLLA